MSESDFEWRGIPWQETSVPKNWSIGCLSFVLESLRSGFACGRNEQVSNGLVHLRPMNISPNGKIDLADCRFVPIDRGQQRLRTGDILFNNTNSPPWVGKTAYVTPQFESFAFSNHMTQLRVLDQINSKFMALQLDWLRQAGYFHLNCNKHVNQASISGEFLRKKIPLLFPPLPEQKRIADKLDAVLGRVDACRARLARVPDLLKRFRQSVLAAATSGRLTEDWRILPMIAGESAYQQRPLGDLLLEPLRNGKSVQDGSGEPVLRLTAFRRGKIDWRESKLGNWEDIDTRRYLVEENDFLIIRGNGSSDLVGRGCLATKPPQNIAFPDTIIRARPDPVRIKPSFLALVWESKTVRNQIEKAAKTTTGLWKVSQGDLESIVLPVPEIKEQQEIVFRVETLFAFADRIETRLTAAKTTIDRLTPATLAKAFRGELVPQDPNDEPASELLARIRKAKAAEPTDGARKTRSRKASA